MKINTVLDIFCKRKYDCASYPKRCHICKHHFKRDYFEERGMDYKFEPSTTPKC